jgi:tRNA dimethylallyltransferase
MEPRKIILIGGPTASGKSAKAMELARKQPSAIINADAMQVYDALPVLSAQPNAADQKEIPHALYGVLDAAEASSAGKWLGMAQAAIEAAIDAGQIPILVGGTGLYFKALLEGLAEIPPIPDEVRAEVSALYDEAGEDKFRVLLAAVDPESAARLAKNDRQRSIRAYEVAVHTGQPLGYWHRKPSPSPLRGAPLSPCKQGEGAVATATTGEGFLFEKILVMPNREDVYASCDARFARMMERGAIDEVKNLLQRKLDPELPAMKTLGVREIGAYLKGEISLEKAITLGQQATRNYAKRQMTWFRNQWKA